MRWDVFEHSLPAWLFVQPRLPLPRFFTVRVAHQTSPPSTQSCGSAAATTAAVASLVTVSALPPPSVKLTSTLIVLPTSEEVGE